MRNAVKSEERRALELPYKSETNRTVRVLHEILKVQSQKWKEQEDPPVKHKTAVKRRIKNSQKSERTRDKLWLLVIPVVFVDALSPLWLVAVEIFAELVAAFQDQSTERFSARHGLLILQ